MRLLVQHPQEKKKEQRQDTQPAPISGWHLAADPIATLTAERLASLRKRCVLLWFAMRRCSPTSFATARCASLAVLRSLCFAHCAYAWLCLCLAVISLRFFKHHCCDRRPSTFGPLFRAPRATYHAPRDPRASVPARKNTRPTPHKETYRLRNCSSQRAKQNRGFRSVLDIYPKLCQM